MRHKGFRLALVLCLLVSLLTIGTQAAQDSQRVLFIGSTAEQSAYYLGRVAAATGNTMEVAALVKTGGTLRHHARNALATAATEVISSTTRVNYTYTYYQADSNGDLTRTTDSMLMATVLEEHWDVIVLEQNPIQAGFPGTYGSDLEFLIDYIGTKQPGADLYWNMAWAYSAYNSISDSTQKTYFSKYYDKDPARMYNAIGDCLDTYILSNQAFDGWFATGAAIRILQDAGQSPISGDTLSTVGKVTAAMTMLNTLCPDADLTAITGSTFGTTLSSSVMTKVRTAVTSAVALTAAPADLAPTVIRNTVETDSADSTADSGYDSFTIADVAAPLRLHFPDITVLKDGTALVSAYENVAHTPERTGYIATEDQTAETTDDDFYAAADAYGIEGVGRLVVWASEDDGTDGTISWDTENPLLVIDEAAMERWNLVDIARTYEERQQSGYVVMSDPRDPNFGLVYTDITGDGKQDEVLLFTFWTRNFKNTSAVSDSLYLMWSTDSGEHWSDPQKLLYEGSKVGIKRGDIASFANGEILMPTYGNMGYCLHMRWDMGSGKWTVTDMIPISNTEEGKAESTSFNEISFVIPDPKRDTAFAYAREPGIVFKSTDRGASWTQIGNEDGLIHQPGFAVIDKNRVFATWADTTAPRYTYGKMFHVNGDWDDMDGMFLYGETVSSGTTSSRDMGDPSSKLMANGDILVVSYDTAYRAIVGTWIPLGAVTVEQPENGHVSVDIDKGLPGEAVTVTALPNPGYKLSKVLVDGVKNTAGTFTITDGDAEYTVTAEFVEDSSALQLSGYLIDLKSSLALTARFSNLADATGYTYTVTHKGETTAPQSLTKDGTTLNYQMTYSDIAAKEMRDTITFTVYHGGAAVYAMETSIYEVAKGWYDGAEEGAYRTMLADMLSYGAAAQTEFGYNTSALEGEGTLTGTTDAPTWTATSGAGVTTGYESKVAVTLSLKDKIELNVYVEDAAAEVSEVTFLSKSSTAGTSLTKDVDYQVQEVKDTQGNTITRVKFDQINVKDVKGAVSFTVKLTDTNETFHVKYSVKDYVRSALNSVQTDLLKALQKYVDSTAAYFAPYLSQVTTDTDELRPYFTDIAS